VLGEIEIDPRIPNLAAIRQAVAALGEEGAWPKVCTPWRVLRESPR